MSSYNTSNYMEQGGARLVIGGELDLESGATLTRVGYPQQFGFAAAAGGANVAEVTVTVQDSDGTTVARPLLFDLWLSDAATGVGLTATSASGTVTVKSASGAVIGTYTAKKALRVQALAAGTFILEITDTAKTGFYVCAQSPEGAVSVSDQLVTGDYG